MEPKLAGSPDDCHSKPDHGQAQAAEPSKEQQCSGQTGRVGSIESDFESTKDSLPTLRVSRVKGDTGGARFRGPVTTGPDRARLEERLGSDHSRTILE